jgi:hypothetical protein
MLYKKVLNLLCHSSNDIALIPDIERDKIFDEFFKIEVGFFLFIFGLFYRFLWEWSGTGTGFIKTFEFFLTGIIIY